MDSVNGDMQSENELRANVEDYKPQQVDDEKEQLAMKVLQNVIENEMKMAFEIHQGIQAQNVRDSSSDDGWDDENEYGGGVQVNNAGDLDLEDLVSEDF